MTFDFSGKAVLVTHPSRGIGKATAIAFAQAGAKVAVHYSQNQAAATAVKDSLSGTGHCIVQADVGNANEVERMVQEAIAHLGKIDVLVNNTGIYQEHPLDKTPYQDWRLAWEKTLNVNLLGAVNAAYCVARSMMEQRSGRIINVTSRGAFRGEPNSPAYGASKAGLNAFSQSLAQHLAPYNIAVTAVAPGWVETDMARSTLESLAGDAIRQQSPLNRVARPEEIAHTILFLAAAESEFLTGGIVDVNGASYLR
jgi:3-oxoacyl-[acyl-carrier protein] reductase